MFHQYVNELPKIDNDIDQETQQKPTNYILINLPLNIWNTLTIHETLYPLAEVQIETLLPPLNFIKMTHF